MNRKDAADIARDVASYLDSWQGKNFERIVDEMTQVIAKYPDMNYSEQLTAERARREKARDEIIKLEQHHRALANRANLKGAGLTFDKHALVADVLEQILAQYPRVEQENEK